MRHFIKRLPLFMMPVRFIPRRRLLRLLLTIMLTSFAIFYFFYVPEDQRDYEEVEPLEYRPNKETPLSVPLHNKTRIHLERAKECRPGWSPRTRGPRKVVDLILFAMDPDKLEVRLRELDPVVDKFIILEAGETFSGLKKPLSFAALKNDPRFKPFMPKIDYRSLDHLEGLHSEISLYIEAY